MKLFNKLKCLLGFHEFVIHKNVPITYRVSYFDFNKIDETVSTTYDYKECKNCKYRRISDEK